MLTGDLAKLGRIGADVAALADVPAAVAERAAPLLEALVQQEFDAGVDPYGVAWVPLAPATVDRGRFAPPLTDTRQLRESLLAYPSRQGLKLTVGTDAHPAGPHQTGWSGRQGSGPARPILPEGELPLAWESVIQDAAIEIATEKLREVSG